MYCYLSNSSLVEQEQHEINKMAITIRNIADKSSSIKQKTDEKTRTVINHFNNTFFPLYRDVKRNGTPSLEITATNFEALQSADITEDFVNCMAGYLQDNVKQFNTAKQYFSAFKCALVKKFPELDNFLNSQSSAAHTLIRKEFTSKCRVNRKPLMEHKIPIEAIDIAYLGNYFWKNRWLEEVALNALDHSLGGRISENPVLEWEDIQADEVVSITTTKCHFRIIYFRGKTALLTAPNIMPHRHNRKVCPLFALAWLAICNQNPSRKIFPMLSMTKISAHINSRIDEAQKAR